MKVTVREEPDGRWEWMVRGSKNYFAIGVEDTQDEAIVEAKVDIDLEMARRAAPKTVFTYGPD